MDGLNDRSASQDDDYQEKRTWLDELKNRIENLEFLIKNRTRK